MSETYASNSYSERVKRLPVWQKLLAFFAIVILLLGGLLFGGSLLRSETGPLVATESPPPLPVETLILREQTGFAKSRAFSGVIRAKRTATLSFPVGGQVKRVLIQEGQSVAKGARLAELDMRADLARLAAANAQTGAAQANLDLAQIEVDRQRALLAKAHISKQRVDNAEAGLDVAATQVEAAQANADAIKTGIGLGTLTAPFSGLVRTRYVDEGVSVSPSAPIVELVEADIAELVLGLPVSFARSLEVGQAYDFTSSTGPFTATLKQDAGVIDRANRTIRTYFELTPSPEAIIGDVATLVLNDSVEETGYLVPRVSLTAAERGLWALYVVSHKTGENGVQIAERRPVEVLYTQLDYVFVRGAINDGEQIVARGVDRLVGGQRVIAKPIEGNKLG